MTYQINIQLQCLGFKFLNQARAWFLKITSVQMYVCVCPPPGLLKTIHVK